MFSETYRPKHLNEIIGQDNAIIELRRWAETWEANAPAYKSAFLYGPPGTGKSSAIMALANDFSWDVLEVDTGDDTGTVKAFRTLIETAIYTNPFKNKCLIIIEECESYKKSYFAAIEDLIEKSVNPIILTANDEYAVKLLTPYFRSDSLMVHFAAFKPWQLKMIASNVLKKEGLEQPQLDKLVDWSHGDLRYVLNNLTNKEIVPRKETDIIFGVVHDIFRGEWDGDTQGADLDFIWYAVKQNVNGFYDTIYGQPTAEFIADIDMLFARFWTLKKQGNNPEAYSLWPYIIKILRSFPMHQKTQKIEVHKSEISNTKVPKYKAFAEAMHCSYKKAMNEFPDELRRNWKPLPKEEVKQVKKERDLFDFMSQSTDGAGGLSG